MSTATQTQSGRRGGGGEGGAGTRGEGRGGVGGGVPERNKPGSETINNHPNTIRQAGRDEPMHPPRHNQASGGGVGDGLRAPYSCLLQLAANGDWRSIGL